MKSTIILLILLQNFLTTQCIIQVVDHSPYCDGLARITSLCSELFIHMMCPRTCQIEHTITKTCGVRKFGDTGGFDSKKRRKRLDAQLDEEENDIESEENANVSNVHHRVRRIVGGKKTLKGAYPWHVALYYKGEQRCAGAILSPDWVVTTAHCFDSITSSYKASDWLVVAGEHSLFVTERTEELRNVKKIIVHERNYKYWKDGYKNVPDDYDVALLKLEKPLLFNDYISTVCLPGVNNMFTSRDQCRIMGWGAQQRHGSRQDTLRDATVKIVPRDVCNLPRSYNGSVHDRAICAGYRDGSADACKYDSGGSLACKKGHQWFGVGLVSFGYQCGSPHLYGVYTNLPFMKSWIIETILGYDDATNSIISIFERIARLNPLGDNKKEVPHPVVKSSQ